MPVRVAFTCSLLEEEQASEEEVAPNVTPPEGVRPDLEKRNVFEGQLVPAEVWRFDLRSEPYEADRSVRLEPRVEVRSP